MAKSDLLVLQEMAEKDMDIRCFTTVVSANTCKEGGHITLGVDRKTIQDVTFDNEKYIAVLYVMDRKQFCEIKNQ